MTERPAEEEVEANNQRKLENEGDGSLVDRDLQDVGLPLPGIAADDDDDVDPEQLSFAT